MTGMVAIYVFVADLLGEKAIIINELETRNFVKPSPRSCTSPPFINGNSSGSHQLKLQQINYRNSD